AGQARPRAGRGGGVRARGLSRPVGAPRRTLGLVRAVAHRPEEDQEADYGAEDERAAAVHADGEPAEPDVEAEHDRPDERDDAVRDRGRAEVRHGETLPPGTPEGVIHKLHALLWKCG